MNEQELMQKLAISKAIMDKSETIKKGSLPQTSLQEYAMPEAKYNIPEGMLEQSQNSYIPPTRQMQPITTDAIKNSKLPDEIKKLMMEHPIAQPQQQSGTLSNELVERATRLMRDNKSEYKSEPSKKETLKRTETASNFDFEQIQEMIEEAVNNALKKNGLLVESTEKSNEVFSFKVGKHVFEGKVTKIKKLS